MRGNHTGEMGNKQIVLSTYICDSAVKGGFGSITLSSKKAIHFDGYSKGKEVASCKKRYFSDLAAEVTVSQQ